MPSVVRAQPALSVSVPVVVLHVRPVVQTGVVTVRVRVPEVEHAIAYEHVP